MKKPRSALRVRFEYLAYRTARAVTSCVGERARERLGELLGLCFHHLGRRRHQILDYNLGLAFPELAEPAREQLARKVARHFGRALLDALHIQTLEAEQLVARAPVDGHEHLEAALAVARPRGLFLLSAHLGAWELAALRAGLLLPGGLALVNRPLDNPLLEAELQALRSRFGNTVLGRDHIARDVLRQIASGGNVGILIDQRAKVRDGLDLPLFGHATPTHSILARLVLKTRAPVLPIFAIRESPGRHVVHFWQPLIVDHLPPEEQAVEPLTLRFMAMIEDAIRRWPEQWLWYHDRWRAERLAAKLKAHPA